MTTHLPEPGTETCAACGGIVSDADDSAVMVDGKLYHARHARTPESTT